MIPPVIHFVWIGDPMPAWAERNIQEFKTLNPEHEIIVHNESALLDKYKPAWETCEFECQKADLLRYSVLEKHGGWYFDVDYWPFRPVKSIEYAHRMNGTRIFVTDSGRPSKLTNSVIGAPANWTGWETVSSIILANRNNKSRNKYGPDIVNRMPKDLLITGGAKWFNGVDVPIAPAIYQKCINGDCGEVLHLLNLTDNQYPFAMHLWAGTNAPRLNIESVKRPVCYMLQNSTKITWVEPILNAFRKLNYAVMQSPDIADIGELPDISIQWNGKRRSEVTDKIKQYSKGMIYLEHGFFDRSHYIQADKSGFLHWASWANSVSEPAPECGKKRLAKFYPHGIKPIRYNNTGYVLVLGQVPGDTQMLDSEINGPVPLQRVVSNAMHKNVACYFRPHPLCSNTRPNRHHVRLPELPHPNERPSYKKQKHGNGLIEALHGAMFVITINSNSIVEALGEGVPCLAFGPHIGINAGAVHPTSVNTLHKDIQEMLRGWRPEQKTVQNYMEWLAARQWNETELGNPEIIKQLVDGRARIETP